MKKPRSGRPIASNYEVCAKSVKMHRAAHMMSQINMAKKIGISCRTLQRVENEPGFKTTPVTAYKIAYELIFNPAIQNPDVMALLNKWDNRKETT